MKSFFSSLFTFRFYRFAAACYFITAVGFLTQREMSSFAMFFTLSLLFYILSDEKSRDNDEKSG